MSVLPVGFGSAVAGGYQIERSLRFNSADTAYLNRTFGTPTNATTWTLSCWIKRSKFGTTRIIMQAGATNTNNGLWSTWNSTDIVGISNSAGSALCTSTAVKRDPSAWSHLVVTNNAGTFTWYENNQNIASGSGTCNINQSGTTHYLGSGSGNNYFFDGYMTEFYFVDGQALTPSSFGQTNSATGVWEPIPYTGTYGNNGFYLNFSDNSGTTSTTLGKDYSGNGNNWTPNLFSVTAGSGNDSMVDTPTSYGTDTGIGGEVRGNYATLNPIAALTGTYSNGNLNFVTATADSTLIANIVMSSGKWYCETTKTSGSANPVVGICSPSAKNGFAPTNANQHPSVVYASSTGNKFINGTGTSYGSTYTTSDVIGIAFDADARELTFYKNGTSQGTITGVPSGDMVFCVGDGDNVNTYTGNFNFGQRAFEKWNGSAYVANTAPSGFKALCTQNLPTPTIGATSTTQANDYFNVKTYTGTGTQQSLTGVGFQPDFIWFKSRSAAVNHALIDAVRGRSKILFSSLTDAEATSTTTAKDLVSFDADGFTVGVPEQNGSINNSIASLVAWNWKANGAGSSNTAGSITSTVSASTTSGFSIVTYTGTSANATVGHGLGAIPAMIMVKNRDSGAIGGAVYHTSMGATKYLKLFQTTTGTDGEATDNTAWNGSSPTFDTNVFSVGSLNRTNSSQQMVAYCFAPVIGYSAFGSYTGNASADGPFVYLGFRPAYVLIKRSSATEAWCIMDSKREGYNVDNDPLFANLANTEGTQDFLDLLSNGFKLRSTDTGVNGTGTYIYACFAESPFKYSLAR